MNYIKVYDALIRNAQLSNRNKKEGIFELHHIIPKCLDGTDDEYNLVLLTPREHYIAHFLLWKNDKTNYKLFAPLLFFKKNIHVKNSRTYNQIRTQHILFMKNNNPSTYLSHTSKKSKSEKLKLYHSNRPAEHNKKISEKAKGKQRRLGAILSDEAKNKISESLKEHYKNNPNAINEETRKKMSLSSVGRIPSAETKLKLKSSAENRKKYRCHICRKI